MAFDWISFFRQHRITYVTHGPSVTKGNVSIACPFCGDDPSEHMGVSLHGKGWHCWRRGEHKGRSPVRLVQALLGCTIAQAVRITGYTNAPPPTDLLSTVRELIEPNAEEPEPPDPPSLPQHFRRLNNGKRSSDPYIEYLWRRGYKSVDWLDRYGLHYANLGPWRGRIIFPVYFEDTLISWTARSIWQAADLRYRTLSTDGEKTRRDGDRPALAPINHFLLWYDEVVTADADTIVLCEGPFDALRINLLGERDGIVASCLFTNLPTEEQIDLLHDVLPRFKRRYLILDADMLAASFKLGSAFVSLDLRPCFLPPGVKDPGSVEFGRRDLLTMCG